MISSEMEFSLTEADRITSVFIEEMEEAYGKNVFPDDGESVFYFDLTVDGNGQITSRLPTPAEIGEAKGHCWSHIFQAPLRFLTK